MTITLSTPSQAPGRWARFRKLPRPLSPESAGAGADVVPEVIAHAVTESDAGAMTIVAAARRLLMTSDYHAVTYVEVADEAGVEPGRVRAAYPAKIDLVLAALGLPGALRASSIARLSGREIVLRYLEFWERDGNTAILRTVLAAAAADDRVVRDVEDYLTGTLLRPLSWGLRKPDACPRVRLLVSTLTGLSFSRYVLKEEPLASGDHETVAAWVGPVVDNLLHGRLEAAV
jgi:AcrR family transcriptional regulator